MQDRIWFWQLTSLVSVYNVNKVILHYASLGFASFDCYAHKIQLAVKDGLKQVSLEAQISLTMEKVKTIIRKIRKSSPDALTLKSMQDLTSLPQKVLIRDVEVRWSSMYIMLTRYSFLSDTLLEVYN